jgi:hypothetical protein
MATRIVLTYTRPSTEVTFMPFTDDLIELLNTYINDGKISNYAVDESDPLILQYTLTYTNDESKKEFRSEAIVTNYADNRNIYNQDNGIKTEIQEFFL